MSGSTRSGRISRCARSRYCHDSVSYTHLYDYSFRQRLALTVGNYWQSGFGNGDTEAIEYHQRWELGRAISLRYGIGRSLRPYDGEREARNFATLTLLWRF